MQTYSLSTYNQHDCEVFILISSDIYETLSMRTKYKLTRIQHLIVQLYPEISELGVQMYNRKGFRGGKAGFELRFQIKSTAKQFCTTISCVFTKDISQIESSSILRQFRQRYTRFVIDNG